MRILLKPILGGNSPGHLLAYNFLLALLLLLIADSRVHHWLSFSTPNIMEVESQNMKKRLTINASEVILRIEEYGNSFSCPVGELPQLKLTLAEIWDAWQQTTACL